MAFVLGLVLLALIGSACGGQQSDGGWLAQNGDWAMFLTLNNTTGHVYVTSYDAATTSAGGADGAVVLNTDNHTLQFVGLNAYCEFACVY